MDKYNFNPEEAFNIIRKHWRNWAASVGARKWVIGISGGKDSTIVAALAAKIFGKETVIGVMMPNNMQSDIKDSHEVCEFLGIQSFIVNIHNAYKGLLDEVCTEVFEKMGLPCNDAFRGASYDTTTNLPARLRMCTLYAIAQTVGGMVLNTCNASEDCIGYSTIFGDNAGSYAPIQGLTVTEIRQLGDWLGLPHNLVHKTPVDGLQSKTDEEKFGFTYQALDWYIREDIGSEGLKKVIDELYIKNKFKTNMVRIPGPSFDNLCNFVRYNNGF